MKTFRRDDRGTATKWFALAAVIVSAGSMAGAHGLAWLSEPGRISVVAFKAPAAAPTAAPKGMADAGVDDTPTGSIPSNGLMIRIR